VGDAVDAECDDAPSSKVLVLVEVGSLEAAVLFVASIDVLLSEGTETLKLRDMHWRSAVPPLYNKKKSGWSPLLELFNMDESIVATICPGIDENSSLAIKSAY
jgi:hypothetical protein